MDTTANCLILASGSPRRREIIAALDLSVELITPSDEEEKQHDGEVPREFVTRQALAKARNVARQASHRTILAADTVVVLDGEVLGKPAGDAEAIQMLRKLRDRVHTVITGVVVLDAGSGGWNPVAKTTDVVMRNYSDEEIAAYVASGEPLDKAGGYAVQDHGFHPALEVRGCYLNVVGLPLCEVVALLQRCGIPARLQPDQRAPEECRDCPLEQVTEAAGA